MVRALEDRVSKGVEVRILGNVGKRGTRLHCLKLAGMRLHARVIRSRWNCAKRWPAHLGHRPCHGHNVLAT